MAWGDRAAEQHEKDQPTEVRIPAPEERKHSDAALVRAYALGHAHSRHVLTPEARDWQCARRWFTDGDAPREIPAEIVLDDAERRGD